MDFKIYEIKVENLNMCLVDPAEGLELDNIPPVIRQLKHSHTKYFIHYHVVISMFEIPSKYNLYLNIESDHKLVLYTFQMFIFCPQKPKIEERKMTMMSGP